MKRNGVILIWLCSLLLFLPGCLSNFINRQEFEIFQSSINRRVDRMGSDLNSTREAVGGTQQNIQILQEQLQEVSSRLSTINDTIRGFNSKAENLESKFNKKMQNMMDEVIKENDRIIGEINKNRHGKSSDKSESGKNIYSKSSGTDLTTGYYYTVELGDSISKIASRYQVSIQDIIAANNLDNPDSLYVGQKLFIPDQSEKNQADTK
ncbi:MAG: LysM peptidoglycan-binding domain-containing protein [Candidatus Aureabacteria bacterium]|nr:LysM peptidoglycan-binding domain-containing protein [Candidatus Auribacterota bacterium]